MRHFLPKALVPVMAFMAVSCALSYENLVLQMMTPSRAGMDLRNKNMSVCVLYEGATDSTIYCKTMSEFIRIMSLDYTMPVSLFVQEYDGGTDYSDRSVLAGMVVSSDADVLLLSVPDSLNISSEGRTRFNLYAYDTQDRNDNVIFVRGMKADSVFVSSTARQMASYFGPRWETGVFRVLFYEGLEDWMTACDHALSGSWTLAIDKWIKILQKSGTLERRMAAEYNIALGCYLTGDIDLAQSWLDRAIADSGEKIIPDFLANLRVLIRREKQGRQNL